MAQITEFGKELNYDLKKKPRALFKLRLKLIAEIDRTRE